MLTAIGLIMVKDTAGMEKDADSAMKFQRTKEKQYNANFKPEETAQTHHAHTNTPGPKLITIEETII